MKLSTRRHVNFVLLSVLLSIVPK